MLFDFSYEEKEQGKGKWAKELQTKDMSSQGFQSSMLPSFCFAQKCLILKYIHYFKVQND